MIVTFESADQVELNRCVVIQALDQARAHQARLQPHHEEDAEYLKTYIPELERLLKLLS